MATHASRFLRCSFDGQSGAIQASLGQGEPMPILHFGASSKDADCREVAALVREEIERVRKAFGDRMAALEKELDSSPEEARLRNLKASLAAVAERQATAAAALAAAEGELSRQISTGADAMAQFDAVAERRADGNRLREWYRQLDGEVRELAEGLALERAEAVHFASTEILEETSQAWQAIDAQAKQLLLGMAPKLAAAAWVQSAALDARRRVQEKLVESRGCPEPASV